MALASYGPISANSPCQRIWALAENYRFEPAFVEVPLCVFPLVLPVNCDVLSIPFLVEACLHHSHG